MNQLAKNVQLGIRAVRQHYTGTIGTAIVLGSGLSNLSLDGYECIAELDYADIDGLPAATAPTHKGQLSILSNGSHSVAICAGRHHLYEGYSAQDVSTLVYLLRGLGAQQLIVTNAAGALNARFRPGQLMLIEDHINATGHNPIIGQDETLGPAFPDMSDAYSRSLRAQCVTAASELGIELHSGVYVGVLGPSLETSAERRMFQKLGADAIGMSTVTEVIAANHSGMQVLGLSAISNMALGDENQQPDSIEQVIAQVATASEPMKKLIEKILANP